MSKLILYLVRHGQTQWNVERREQGWRDSPLTSLGRKQAATNAILLKEAGIGRIYASPLGRVRETVKILVNQLDAEVIYDDRLKEINMGDWEGKTHTEARGQYPDVWEAWQCNYFGTRVPNGESLHDVGLRLIPLLDELKSSMGGDDRCIAIVSHEQTTQIMLAHFLGEISRAQEVQIPNDVVYRVWLRPNEFILEHFVRGEGPKRGLFGS